MTSSTGLGYGGPDSNREAALMGGKKYGGKGTKKGGTKKGGTKKGGRK